MQLSQLRYYTSSEAAMRTLAENYVGLPFEATMSNPDSRVLIGELSE